MTFVIVTAWSVWPSVILAQNIIMDVPMIYQKPELPEGCEVTALAMAMNYRGISVSKTELADRYVPRKDFYYNKGKLYGPNPFVAYAGNPRKDGWFCYAPPIVQGANQYFQEKGQSFFAVNLTGKAEEEILAELRNGHPVLVWVTIRLESIRYKTKWHFEDTGQYTPVPSNLHCVLLHGVDEQNVYYSDPLFGKKVASKGLFFQRYYDLGGHAVVIRSSHQKGFQAGVYGERAPMFRILTAEGCVPVSDPTILKERPEEVLIDIDRAADHWELEWFLSPVNYELCLHNDETYLTLPIHSTKAIRNKEILTLKQKTQRIGEQYYVSMQSLIELFGQGSTVEELMQEGW